MDPLERTGIYEIGEPVFGPLGRVCFGAADWLTAHGFHPLFSLAVAVYLYFGTMVSPFVILKLAGLTPKRRKEEGC